VTKRFLKIGLLSLLIWQFSAIYGYAGEISAELDKTVGTLSDEFIYTLSVSSRPNKQIDFPGVEGLDIYQAGTSQNTTIINGKINHEIRYQFVLRPKRKGKFLIPPLRVMVDGKYEETLPLKFTVGEDPRLGSNGNETPAMYVEREISNSKPYVGQPILSVVRFFTSTRLLDAGIDPQTPSKIKRIPIKGEKDYNTVINGVKYRVIEISAVLVPLQAGEIDLEPLIFEAKVRVARRARRTRRRDVFEDFFGGAFGGGRAVTKRLLTKIDKLEVQPIPTKGRPAGFSGLVGNFNLSAKLSKRTIVVGDTVTLTVDIQGYGNLEGMQDIEFSAGDAFKVYADKPIFIQRTDRVHGLVAKKTFKYAVVPTTAGAIDLGVLKIKIFNTEKKQFETLTARIGTLTAQGGAAESSSSRAGTSYIRKKKVKSLGEDLINPHFDQDLLENDNLTFKDLIIFGGLSGLPFLILAFAGTWLRMSRKSRGNIAKKRSSKAYREFKSDTEKTYREIKGKNFDQKNSVDALGVLSEAFKSYLGNKFNRQGQALTAKDLGLVLTQKKVKNDTIEKSQELQKTFDHSIYSGRGMEPVKVRALAAKMDNLVKELERQC